MDNLVASNNYGILQIISIKNCGKYKIVEAITTELEDNTYITGIVDENNIECFPFEIDVSIKYLGEKNFLIRKENIYYHYKYNSKDELKLKNKFEKYIKIDSKHFLVEYKNKKAVYNIDGIINPYFDLLTNFFYSKKYHKKIASFADCIKTADGKYIALAGMIDMENKFTNNVIYNITNNELIKIRSNEEYIEYCNQLATEKTNENIIKKVLQKVIKPLKNETYKK